MLVLASIVFLEEQNKSGKLRIYFLNVGMGDSIFIETPDKHRIIIDGGPDNQAMIELGKHLPFYDRHLDLVVLTHPDSDHLTGLLEILKRYPVDQVMATGVWHDTDQYSAWLDLLADQQISIKAAQAGQEFSFGQANFRVLYPEEDLEGQTVDNLNNTSIVLRLDYGNNCFLFTGDAEIATEKALLASGEDLDCSVLKVSHHGSNTGSSQEFLSAVNPDYAIIQVGDNHFGLPSLRVIRRLERQGAKVLRTDQEGEILIIGDSQTLQPVY